MTDLFGHGDDETPQAKGGKARAEKLTPEERSAIARKAATRRWSTEEEVLQATHGSMDRPLIIGELRIPCYVLRDGRRVLSLGGMIDALGMSKGSGTPGRGDRLAQFVGSRTVSPFLSNDLSRMMNEPIRFRAPSGGSIAFGYEATLLPEICDAVLESRKSGQLLKRQEHIADRCEILVRGLARVGIIALVDEATGYQELRDRAALEEILNKYISKELQKWTKTFPDEYFLNIFRLKGWKLPEMPTARPGAMSFITKDIVYSRLAPGVLKELETKIPTDGHGRRKAKLFQGLTPDLGHPKLKEHLRDVTLLMRATDAWEEFRRMLDRTKPRISTPDELPYYTGEDEKEC